MRQDLRGRIWEILEVADDDDRESRNFDIFIMTLILLNVVAVILETVDSLSSRYGVFFSIFEVFSVTIFTIEYILRLWTCTVITADKGFWKTLKGRIKFALTPFALIDLMAILPFYLPMIFAVDLRFLRILRLLRFGRLFKILRYSSAPVDIIRDVLKGKKTELGIALSVVIILLVFASSLMYFVEHAAQPNAFPNIPAAMWWGVATLTTVGYGDVYPITPMGKSLGAIIAMLGILMFALPTGILSSGFTEKIREEPEEKLDQEEIVATIQKGNPGTDEIELLIKLSVEKMKNKGQLNVRIK